jgi:hypothetical protein
MVFKISIIITIRIITLYIFISDIQFYIINVIIPFLFLLIDIDKLKVYYNNIQDVFITNLKEILIIKHFGYAFLIYKLSL